MLGKRGPTVSGVSGYNHDVRGCKLVHARLRIQHADGFTFPSEEAESHGLRGDPPGYCKRIRRLVPSSQGCPRRGKRTHQAFRGIS